MRESIRDGIEAGLKES